LAAKDTASSSGARNPVTDKQKPIEEQLADALKEAQNALGEWRSYPNQYYEDAWVEAIAKARRLIH